MPHYPQPFFREKRRLWYVQIDGKQHNLGPDETQAQTRYHELMSARGKAVPEKAKPTASAAVVEVIDDYLEWCRERKSPQTYKWYFRFLEGFAKFIGGRMSVDELKPAHVDEWTYKHRRWSRSTIRGAILTVQRAFRWAERHHRISSPLHGMEKPEAESRELFLNPEQFKAITSVIRDVDFLDLVTFLWETGARPQEAFRAEACHFDRSRIVFPRQQSKGKKKARVIYLSDRALAIVKRRIASQGEGAILRHCKGGPWNKNNVNVRFRRVRKKVGIDGLCAYTLRHSFATHALLQGVDPVTLSHLMGHSDLKMITKVYAHIAQNDEHLLAALRKATA